MCLIPKKIWQKKKVLFGIKIIRHGLFPIIKTSIYFLNGLTQIRYQ